MRQKKRIENAVYKISSGGYLYDCHYFAAWTTKYCANIFDNAEKKKQIIAILDKIASANEITIDDYKVTPNRIFLEMTFPPKLSLTNAVKALKGVAARKWFESHAEDRKKVWQSHLWSRQNYIGTLGNIVSENLELFYMNQRTNKSPAGRKPKNAKEIDQ